MNNQDNDKHFFIFIYNDVKISGQLFLGELAVTLFLKGEREMGNEIEEMVSVWKGKGGDQ